MFIIFSGLPGTGKSSIAQQLATAIKSIYLRIDSIEQAIKSAEILADQAEVGPAGYLVAYRLAADNLRLGHTVIADSVNPMKITRDAYRNVAEQLGIDCLEVEVICSDRTEHRRRVETRRSPIEGLTLPSWQQVESRHYEAWDRPCLRLDTATSTVCDCVKRIVTELGWKK